MAGGILELVARGEDDIFLTNEPQITFFKLVYRRHTNFSKAEHDIQFDLNYGGEVGVVFPKYGDLLHRLYLVINLPRINITYKQLSIQEIQTILLKYGIVWTTTSKIYTPSDYQEISILIDNQLASLNTSLTILDYLLNLINNGPLNPPTWLANNPSYHDDPEGAVAYYTDFLNYYYGIDYDPYSIEWNFLYAHQLDRKPYNLELANFNTVQFQLLFDKYKNFVIGNENVSPPFPPSYNDDNLLFLYNIDYANYNINTINRTSYTIFTDGVANQYPDDSYKTLDSYIIFNDMLLNDPSINSTIINSIYDVNRIKSILLDTGKIDIQRNILQLVQIYYSLMNTSKFMFYRLFKNLSNNNFNTTSSWNNLSLSNNTNPNLQDNWTNKFNITTILPGQPANLYHPMEILTKNTISTFHNTNRDNYREAVFTPYFNFLNFWQRTDVGTSSPAFWQPTIDTYPQKANFNRMYFMNYIPILTNNDIPPAFNTVLLNEINKAQGNGDMAVVSAIQNIMIVLGAILPTVRAGIESTIVPIICKADDFNVLLSISGFRSIQGANGDIIITSIIRQGEHVGNQTIPAYILDTYTISLSDPFLTPLPHYSTSINPNYLSVFDILTKTLGYFNTVSDFTNYQANGFNIDPDYPINTTSSYYSDQISSIWGELVGDFVTNYDNFYTTLLGDTVFGNELDSYIDYITSLINPTSYYIDSDTFQTLLPYASPGTIGIYLADKLGVLENQLTHFNVNYGLMGVTKIPISTNLYFAKFIDILDYLTNIIETTTDSSGNLVYYHVPHGGPNDPVTIIYNQLLLSQPNTGTMDIIGDVNGIFLTMIDPNITVNPFSPLTDPNKHNYWIELHNTTYDYQTEVNKYNTLFGNLTSPFLYTDLERIKVDYNEFGLEYDVYSYMMYIITVNATLFDVFIGIILGGSVTVTGQRAIIVLGGQKKKTDKSIGELGDLKILLFKSLKGGTRANFAWIKYLGHYMIKYVRLFIGDQLIDEQNGEQMHIYYELTKRRQKERGYNSLIGNVPELNTYDDKLKDAYQLIIPLQFFFCKEIGLALPLVALNHTEVKITIALKPFNEICYYDDLTVFNRSVKLSTKMIAEYIFLEESERNLIATNKNEYLITKMQSSGDFIINTNLLDEFKLYFKNCVRELWWVIQDVSNIVKNPEVYYVYDNISPANKSKIVFAGRDRENYKDYKYYNYIQPMKFHSATPSLGINTYSFCVNPENYQQPSGSANMGRLDDTAIKFVLDDKVIEGLKNGLVLRGVVYGVSHNILRIVSGLGGLVFYE